MLSVVITAWNEQQNLPRAVASVKAFADEIVVIDTESTDDTAKVAKALGCKVFRHKNTGIVEPVRNFSISKAKGDWILLLDADEEIPLSLAKYIQNLIAGGRGDYYRIPRKNLIFNRWIQSHHWWPDYVYRLFKKGFVTWDDAIHSIPFTRGIGLDLPDSEDLAILHHSYSSVSQFVDRMNRYTDHQVEYRLGQGYGFSWRDILIRPHEEFLNQYFSRGGYRDGFHGLALALLQSFSELVLYLKLWQKSGFVENKVAVDAVSAIVSDRQKNFRWWKYQVKIDQAAYILKPFWKIIRKIGL